MSGRRAAENAPANHLAVYLSGRCGLACHYCYSRDADGPVIGRAALLKALGDFLRDAPRGAKISFLGGEPLLHKPLLRTAVRFIRKKAGARLPVTVFTNGRLLDRSIAAFLRAAGARIVLNASGVTAGAGVRGATVSVVTTPRSAGRLAENIASLYGAGFRSIAWAPDVTARWDKTSLARLSASAALLKRFYLGLLRAGLPPYELANAYEAIEASRGFPARRGCFSLTLGPDGNIYPCDKLPGLGRPSLKKVLDTGRKGFFAAAAAAGFRPAETLCPVGPWAVKGCPDGRKLASHGAYFSGQAAARRIVRSWLAGVIRAAMRFPAFRRRHNVR